MIGLAGAVGSGKSTVAEYLRAEGASVFCADEAVHRLLRVPAVRRRIEESLGVELPAGGAAARRTIAERIFGRAEDRLAVEAVLHPLVEERLRAHLRRAERAGHRAVVLDVPLLLETGMERRCDLLVFVRACRDVRRARLARGRGWSPQEVRLRERAQLATARKQAACDAIVDNAGTRARTRAQVRKLWNRLVSRQGPEDVRRVSYAQTTNATKETEGRGTGALPGASGAGDRHRDGGRRP